MSRDAAINDDDDAPKEQDAFQRECDAWCEVEEEVEVEEKGGEQRKLIPYNLQTQHSLPDKSIADCMEALIGCYLVTCGQRAALQFMAWIGLKVNNQHIYTLSSHSYIKTYVLFRVNH